MNKWLSSFFNPKFTGHQFGLDFTTDGIDFFVDKSIFAAITSGKCDEYLTAQYVALQMLDEQGEAERMPNGYIVPAKTIVSLDEDIAELLTLPPRWLGRVEVDIKGTTNQDSFNAKILVESPSGAMTAAYKINGPCITFGSVCYLLSRAAYSAFKALEQHQDSARQEYDNLTFMFALQSVQKEGLNITLKHFDKLNIHVPDKVTIEAELDQRGNLILTPNVGQKSTNEQMQRVLGQIMAEQAQTIKVGKEIILFNEKRALAVKDVLSNRVIPKNKVKLFLENPTAFLDATLVDLDVGFALRVKGAIRFKQAYFGDTDESGINWFGASNSTSTIQPFNTIVKTVKTKEDLLQLEQTIEDAKVTGATEITFQGKSYDIGSPEDVKRTIAKLKQQVENVSSDDESSQPDNGDNEVESATEVIVVDIALNDESLDLPSKTVQDAIDNALYSESLDWSNYKRTPFPHQVIGIKWILGLEALAQNDDLVNGALLADDMGLGKTFMALSAVENVYRLCDEKQITAKPTLIVAPLSLIENWRDEVDATFHNSPFRDIVILQTDGDLSRFRDGGVEIKASNIDEESFEPRTSLLFGEDAGVNRLDMPKRLVITTYQTLRDYQFSLSKIDWGIVVFDEAQNIKNPNALQTRAAKGLKAKFKLLATGTPVENSLADFWCLMDTACPGYLDSYQNFRQRYIAPIIQAAGDEIEQVRAHLGRQLREAVGKLMLRRVKEDNLKDLPSKTIFVGIDGQDWKYHPPLHSVMNGHQRKVYDGAIDAQVESEEGHVLTTLQRLRDSSLHPRLVDSGQLIIPSNKRELEQLFDESAKLNSVIKTLLEIQSRKEKCIIFAVNKRLQRFLSVALGQKFGLGPLHIVNGDAKAVVKRGSALSRKSMIKDFELRDGFNIIIMSPVAAGVGLTVVGANNVIHFERHWNPAKEAQATDRVYRIGQKKDVNIYIPVLHHPEFESFDVNLHRLLSKKTLLRDAVVTPEEVVPNPAGSDKLGLTPQSVIYFEDFEKLSWKQFEALCVEVLAKEFKSDAAYLTNDGSDFGADGILLNQNSAILIQAKHKSGSYSGYKAVQEIDQATKIYKSALVRDISKQIFITNATKLGNSTYEIAQKLAVEIIDGNVLRELCAKHQVTFKQVLNRLIKDRYIVHDRTI